MSVLSFFDKLVQITTPVGTTTDFEFESGYPYVDVLCVGSGGNGASYNRTMGYGGGGGGSGAICYRSDLPVSDINEECVFTLASPGTTGVSTMFTYIQRRTAYIAGSYGGITAGSGRGGDGGQVFAPNFYLQTEGNTFMVPGNGGGSGTHWQVDSSLGRKFSGASGGGVTGPGVNWGYDVDVIHNGVSEERPNITSYTGFSGGNGHQINAVGTINISLKGGDPGANAYEQAVIIPFLALGGIGYTSATSIYEEDTDAYIGGGGGGSYGFDGSGGRVTEGFSQDGYDGDYGAGGGGGGASGGDGGDGTIVLFYHG